MHTSSQILQFLSHKLTSLYWEMMLMTEIKTFCDYPLYFLYLASVLTFDIIKYLRSGGVFCSLSILACLTQAFESKLKSAPCKQPTGPCCYFTDDLITPRHIYHNKNTPCISTFILMETQMSQKLIYTCKKTLWDLWGILSNSVKL